MSIAQLFDKVPYNSTRRFNCPECGGNNSLTITKEQGKVKYNCFKLRCSLKAGSRHVRITNGEGKRMLAARNALQASTEGKEAFTIPEYWIQGLASKKCFQMLLNHNAIESYTLGLFKIALDPKKNRLVYLIQNNLGSIVGGVGRTLANESPKSYNYPSNSNIPFTCGTGKIAVLVEDCASACSIGRFKDFTGVALLGTDITTSYLFYIINNFSTIILTLDNDATSKSVKLRQALEYYSDNVTIWKMGKDFKDMFGTEIQEFIASKNLNYSNT